MMIENADLRSRSGPIQSYLENGSGSSGLAKMSSSDGGGSGWAEEEAGCEVVVEELGCKVKGGCGAADVVGSVVLGGAEGSAGGALSSPIESPCEGWFCEGWLCEGSV